MTEKVYYSYLFSHPPKKDPYGNPVIARNFMTGPFWKTLFGGLSRTYETASPVMNRHQKFEKIKVFGDGSLQQNR
jgi:hypothetical protein